MHSERSHGRDETEKSRSHVCQGCGGALEAVRTAPPEGHLCLVRCLLS